MHLHERKQEKKRVDDLIGKSSMKAVMDEWKETTR